MQSFQPPRRILMGPGPSDVSPRVLAALARPTIGHLDPEFQAFMEDTKAALSRLFNAPDHACIPLPAPGTAGASRLFPMPRRGRRGGGGGQGECGWMSQDPEQEDGCGGEPTLK